MLSKKFVLGALMLLAFGAFAVSAAPLGPLTIDFRNVAWNGAGSSPSFTVGTVTATALPSGSLLYQDNIDGLGILGGEPDEVDNREVLEITFASAVKVLSFGITDLFQTTDGGGNPVGEVGQVIFYYLGSQVGSATFDGINSDQANGEQLITLISGLTIDKAEFMIGGTTAVNNEFSVAGFNVTAPDEEQVPEPGTISMMVLGLGCLALAYRKRASNKA